MASSKHQDMSKVNKYVPKLPGKTPYLVEFGTKVKITKHKLHSLLERNAAELDNEFVNIDEITKKIMKSIPDMMTLNEMYSYITDYCASRIGHHPDFNKLASRLSVERLHKCIPEHIVDVTMLLYNNHDVHNKQCPLISDELYRIVLEHGDKLQKVIDMNRDYYLDYFGIRTLERSYLARIHDKDIQGLYKGDKKGRIIEGPQHMLIRVAIGIHGDDLPAIIETYEHLSHKYFIHATPTLFNAGTPKPQLSSCFVADTEVYTLNRGIQTIQEVKLNDVVVAHSGNAQTVSQLHINPLNNRTIYKLKLEHTKEIYATDNHRFYKLMDNKSEDVTVKGEQYPDWQPVESLKVGDYLAVSNLIDQGKSGYRALKYFKSYNDFYHFNRALGVIVDYDNKKEDEMKALQVGNKLYLKITGLEPTNLNPENVYTLGVNNDNSYSVEGVLTDNCYLIGMDDNLQGIFKTITSIAHYSKWAGGIGVHLTGIRAKGSLIRGTNGISDGIIPLCILLNKLAKYINQGGKRNGSIAVYLEVFHADIFEFCELRKNTKDEDTKARDLFLALWVCDLFMKRVKEDGIWSLMCPDECPGLNTSHGVEFERLYTQYEEQKKYKRQVKAVDLFYHIMECQIETGNPYMLYKDNANAKSNQKNLGTIQSSNLCAEIIQYSDGNTTSVCNLASICLPRFIITKNNTKVFDYDKLVEVTRMIVRNINRIIDRNFYPTEEAKYTNTRDRPMGIGVQGLADVYNIFMMPFGSDGAKAMNKRIFEHIYYGALFESCELAKKYGTYKSFAGSPFSKGELQWHMWNVDPKTLYLKDKWALLVNDIIKYGTRNSLLTTIMPTATTSQIMKNSEAIEPHQSNIYVRSTIAGEFIVQNEYLVKELLNLKLWDDTMRKRLLIENGSIQNIKEIPQHVRDVFKTAFEIKQKDIITQAAERGPFIDQSQSMNLFMEKPNYNVLSSCHIVGHSLGLKTGMYYLRGRPAVDPIQFGIDPDELEALKKGVKYNPQEKKKVSKLASIGYAKDAIIEKADKPAAPKKTAAGLINVIECVGCGS